MTATLVVGVGEVGSALATVLGRNEEVLCHDIEPQTFEQSIEVMHLCFPFTSRQQFVETALSYVRRFEPKLVIINSTVAPGTTRLLAKSCKAAVAFSPVRGKHSRMVNDLLRYVKFVASTEREAAERAAHHFERNGIKTRIVDKVETLELAKLAETTYFGLLIAYAQELNRFAAQCGAEYEQILDFFEEIDFLPRWRYFPGFIGGHCVIPNIQLLKQQFSSPLLDAILDSNERRAVELASTTANGSNSKREDARKPWPKHAG